MWFLLLAGGAVVVQLAGVPAGRRLPVPPPPGALLVAWFLFAVVVRFWVLRVRLAAFERKARKLARRAADKDKGLSPIGELGLGVGRGALQAVGGDVVGASLSLMAALLRGAAGSLKASPPPPRERRRGTFREQLSAVLGVLGVGLTCIILAWWPVLREPALRFASPALRELGLAPAPPKPVVDRLQRRDNIGPLGTAPAPAAPVQATPEPAAPVQAAPAGNETVPATPAPAAPDPVAPTQGETR